jgi:hypothetical protein
MKLLLENWEKYLKEADQDEASLQETEEVEEVVHETLVPQEDAVEEGLVQENVGGMIAGGVNALLSTGVGRRMLAWALRVPEKLATAVFEPMRKWSRPTLEAKLGADSKTLALSDWIVDNVGWTGVQGLALGKLADLIEGLSDKDAKDLTGLAGQAQIAEQEFNGESHENH